MKGLTSLSYRERILLVVLTFSLAIGSYMVVRVKQLNTTLIIHQEQLEDSEKKLKQTKVIKYTSKNAQSLLKTLEKTQKNIAMEQQRLAEYETSFTDLSRSDAIARIKKSITQLSDKHRLRLISIKKSTATLHRLAGVEIKADHPVLTRPQFDVQFTGDFFQINQFISEMKELPTRVVITKIALTNENTFSHSPKPILRAALTLAI